MPRLHGTYSSHWRDMRSVFGLVTGLAETLLRNDKWLANPLFSMSALETASAYMGTWLQVAMKTMTRSCIPSQHIDSWERVGMNAHTSNVGPTEPEINNVSCQHASKVPMENSPLQNFTANLDNVTPDFNPAPQGSSMDVLDHRSKWLNFLGPIQGRGQTRILSFPKRLKTGRSFSLLDAEL